MSEFNLIAWVRWAKIQNLNNICGYMYYSNYQRINNMPDGSFKKLAIYIANQRDAEYLNGNPAFFNNYLNRLPTVALYLVEKGKL